MFDPSWVLGALNNTTVNASLGDFLGTALSNPRVALAIVVEVLLGAGLGYIMAKMAKYIIAFIALLVVGAVLNVWSLGGSVEDFLSRLGSSTGQLKDIILGFMNTLGLLMVGPVTLGFFIGLALGVLKK